MKTDNPGHQAQLHASWQALAYFNIYRLIISGLFVSLYWIDQLPSPLGTYDETLFTVSAHVYFLGSVIIFFFIHLQSPRYRLQVAAHVLLDIIILSALMYASAGLGSGFGMLLVIAVAGGSMLSTKRIAILFAALATIAVLGEELSTGAYLGLDDPSQSRLATGLALERRSFVSRTVRIAELTLWALTDPEATTWVKEEFYQCH